VTREGPLATHWVLVGLLAFVALIACAHGGWLIATAAESAVPGVILLVGVGGTAAVAALLALLHHARAAQVALAAGIVLLLWIVSQMVTLHRGSWLQMGDLVIADAILLLATSRPAQDRAHAHHAA
jgi:hypothetical protein